MRQAIRIGVLVAAVVVSAAACQSSADDPYTVFAGVPGPTSNDPMGNGTVRVTVDGEVVTDGTEAFTGEESYRHDFPVEPGQTIVVDVTSKDDEPNCDVTKDPGPTAENLEISVTRSEQDSSGTWRTRCTWQRP